MKSTFVEPTIFEAPNQDRPIPKPRKSLTKIICNNIRVDSISSTSEPFTNNNSVNGNDNIVSVTLTPVLNENSIPSPMHSSATAVLHSPPPPDTPPPCPVSAPPGPPPLPPRSITAQLPSTTIPNRLETIELKSVPSDDQMVDHIDSKTFFGLSDPWSINGFISALPAPSSECSVEFSLQSNLIKTNSVSTIPSSTSLSLKSSNKPEECSNDNGDVQSNSISSTASIICNESICFSGWVRLLSMPKMASVKKDPDRRYWGVIRSGQLFFTKDDETVDVLIGPFDLYRCIYVGRGIENYSEINIVLREVTLATSNKSVPWSSIKFVPELNIEYWLMSLAKCHSPKVSILQQTLYNVDIGGKLWIREGVSGNWVEGWASVYNRMLRYWNSSSDSMHEINIRKIIVLKRDCSKPDFCNYIENSADGPLLIAVKGSSLYLQAECDMCSELWFNFLNVELRNNSHVLEENRLTDDDVPVIVDKCIRLIVTYGLYQPGIYRRNGSAILARNLLNSFKEDPFNISLESVSDESINAVADILRSFFRQLDQPLIPVDVHDQLFQIAESFHPIGDKVETYSKIIFNLSKVRFSTIKRLLSHLQEITTHSDKNLATIDNISKVFGPTIFTVDKFNEEITSDVYARTGRQILVMRDLLINFNTIFHISIDEMNAKFKLDQIQDSKKNSKVRAEGFLVPIHLFEKDNKCFNVQCDWTAAQVVSFKVEKLVIDSDVSICDSYALFEVLNGGQLERRISGDEILKQIVLGRWLEWETVGLENFLLLKKDEHPFSPQNTRPFADNIKIAEPGSKSFKTAQLKVESGTKIVHYNKVMKVQNEWVVDETLWFYGCETERKPPYPYTLTFFLCNGSNNTNRTKCRAIKFSGYCVAFKEEKLRTNWLNSVILCKQEYLPLPIIQI